MISLSENNIDILDKSKIIIVVSTASHCEDCLKNVDTIDKLSILHPDIIFANLDVMVLKSKAREFGLNRLPNITLFKNGVKVDWLMGVPTKEEIASLIEINKG